jgi:transcriptional regulator with XRE-family HTH domain
VLHVRLLYDCGMNQPIPSPDHLRNVRIRRLLSQQRLADKAGVTRSTIALLEAGQAVPAPRLETIRKLCEALGVAPDEVTEFRRALEAASGLPLQRSYMRARHVDPDAAHLPPEPYTPRHA